jgi:hypothetical protein
LNILKRYQANKLPFFIDDGQFFNLIFLQRSLCLLQGNSFRRCDEVFFGHDSLYRRVHILLKTHITIGDYACQLTLTIYDGNTSYLKFLHDVVGLLDGGIYPQGQGSTDQSALGAFHFSNVLRLQIYFHVFMNKTQPSFHRNTDRQFCLGYSIHAAETIGMFNLMLGVSWLEVFVSLGRISEYAGTRSTSS